MSCLRERRSFAVELMNWCMRDRCGITKCTTLFILDFPKHFCCALARHVDRSACTVITLRLVDFEASGRLIARLQDDCTLWSMKIPSKVICVSSVGNSTFNLHLMRAFAVIQLVVQMAQSIGANDTSGRSMEQEKTPVQKYQQSYLHKRMVVTQHNSHQKNATSFLRPQSVECYDSNSMSLF